MTTVGEQIAAFAHDQLGKPYHWGATGPDSYDCSGLLYAAYKAAGVDVPHQRASWWGKQGTAVDQAHAAIGDVVYYDEPGTTDHVGIWIGGGKMIDAPTEGQDVEIANVGSPTSIRHLDATGTGVVGAPATGTGNASSDGGGLLDSLNPFATWQTDVTNLGLKLMAGGCVAALLVFGVYQTIHEKGT